MRNQGTLQEFIQAMIDGLDWHRKREAFSRWVFANSAEFSLLERGGEAVYSLESCSTVERLKNCHVDLFSLFLFSFLFLVEMFALICIELFANDVSEKSSRTSVSRLLRTPLEWIFAKRSYREQRGTKCRGKIGLCYSWLPIRNVAFYSDI